MYLCTLTDLLVDYFNLSGRKEVFHQVFRFSPLITHRMLSHVCTLFSLTSCVYIACQLCIHMLQFVVSAGLFTNHMYSTFLVLDLKLIKP